ncbi:hypothetical protein QFZ94_007440 [Paraburkholderia sp. JPY465]|uniref:hypothetical protein n=1 Tax=Paraburkholderia sp. JPY465 TaxID=3042285 RepID=UPI003D212D57
MNDEFGKNGLEAIALNSETLLRIMQIVRERGELEGRREAYLDICAEIDKSLAEAQEKLTRPSEQQIVRGLRGKRKINSARTCGIPGIFPMADSRAGSGKG